MTDALFILNKSVFFKVTFWNQSSGTVAGLEKNTRSFFARRCKGLAGLEKDPKAAAWKKHSFLNDQYLIKAFSEKLHFGGTSQAVSGHTLVCAAMQGLDEK